VSRAVLLNIEPDTFEAVTDITNYMPFHQAIGYLSNWALGSGTYTQVVITACSDGDLTAVYSSQSGESRYVLSGIWRPEEGRYSFHS